MFEILAQSSSSSDAAATGVGIIFLLLYAIVGIGLLVFHIYVLVDLLKYSDPAWQASGQNKTLWIVLWVVTLCCGFSLILDLVYWFAIRPKLQAAQAGPGAGGYPNYPG